MICQKENKLFNVYRHITPSNKVYIGITSQNPYYRWNRGRGYFNASKSLFKSAIIKYGWDNIIHEVLFTELDEKRAKQLEKDLIRHYKNLNRSLNLTDGGEGTIGLQPWNKGLKLSYEQSNKLLGKKFSDEHRHNLSLSHKGKSLPKGRRLTQKQIENLRRINTGRVKSEEEKAKISRALSKPVLVFDKQMQFIGRFDSGTSAARYLQYDVSGVLKCCRGKQKTCKGYIIRFETQ